ncbi:MAG: hypothetical protein R3E95_18325 [Thiolinea sp.]
MARLMCRMWADIDAGTGLECDRPHVIEENRGPTWRCRALGNRRLTAEFAKVGAVRGNE